MKSGDNIYFTIFVGICLAEYVEERKDKFVINWKRPIGYCAELMTPQEGSYKNEKALVNKWQCGKTVDEMKSNIFQYCLKESQKRKLDYAELLILHHSGTNLSLVKDVLNINDIILKDINNIIDSK